MHKDVIRAWIKSHKNFLKSVILYSISITREAGFNLYETSNGIKIGNVIRGSFKSLNLLKSIRSNGKRVGSFHVHRTSKNNFVDDLSPYDLIFFKKELYRFAVIGFKYEEHLYAKLFYFKKDFKGIDLWEKLSYVTLFLLE